MKKMMLFLLLGISINIFPQFRDQHLNKPSIHEGIVSQQSELLLGFFNPNNFTMRHSYSMSYSTFGGHGLALGLYTNSMMYQITENLNIQADVSLMHSPYSTFGKGFQDNFNGIYLSRAQLNFKPSDDFLITVQYRNIPAMYYSQFGYGMNANPWFHRSPGHEFYIGR